MRLARFVRTFGLLLVLGMAGFGSGCGQGSSTPISREEDTQIRESKKQVHRQGRGDARKAQEDLKTQSTQKRAAQRAPGDGDR